MILNGKDIGQLIEVVVSAFSRSDLTILVRVELDTSLDHTVSTDDGWRYVVFSFIDALNLQGRGLELVRIIRKARPQHTALIAYCDELESRANGKAQPASEGALREAIEAFNKGFLARTQLFSYVNAYKALHDVLHDIQSFQPTLKKAVEARRADPSKPFPDDVAIYLEERLAKAKKKAKNVEFPADQADWIDGLETAYQVFTGAEVTKMPRQLERVKVLVSNNLFLLNKELVANARRLQPEQLIGSLNDILTSLGSNGSSGRRALRASVEEFRDLCSELDGLSRAHNLCQKINDALVEAVGLPSVTAEGLTDWHVAKKSLTELAADRSADKRVQLTNEAAKNFEGAKQADAFRSLIERFDMLFIQTDKSLLEVTNDIPPKANALHAALESFK